MYLLQELFAGAWSLIWHWGAGVAAIILCLLFAYFSPLYKAYALYAAGIIAMCLFAYGAGIVDESHRCQIQNAVATKHINAVVDKAVTHTKTKKARKAVDPCTRSSRRAKSAI